MWAVDAKRMVWHSRLSDLNIAANSHPSFHGLIAQPVCLRSRLESSCLGKVLGITNRCSLVLQPFHMAAFGSILKAAPWVPEG